MSDQPKPTGEPPVYCDHVYSRSINPFPRHCIKCDEIEGTPETKPTTGEWTVDGCTVIDSNKKAVFVCDSSAGAWHLADAHTSALYAAVAEATKDLQHALIDTLNQREDAIAEAHQPLVEMLEGVFELYPHLTEIQKLLAKVKEGK